MEYILPKIREAVCLYCKTSVDLEQWSSEWIDNDNLHYKRFCCEKCGRKNWFKVNFQGSGHDSLLKKEAVSLESMIKKVLEKH